MKKFFCAFLSITVFHAGLADVSAQGLPMEVDLSNPQLVWTPDEMRAWPDHLFEKDPWTTTALHIVERVPAKRASIGPEEALALACEFDDRLLFKALGMEKVTRISEPVPYIGDGAAEADIVVTKYDGGVPFELRRSKWVWVLLIPGTRLAPQAAIDKLGIDVEAIGGKFVDVSSAKVPELKAQLSSAKAPPYLASATVLLTSRGIAIAGSNIKGDLATPPSHNLNENIVWFRQYKK